MNIFHYKLKDRILNIIASHARTPRNSEENATAGAKSLFEYFRNHFNEEIFLLYLNRCEQDFNSIYRFESVEPPLKGLLEARYFIIRMFNISFADYFNYMSDNLLIADTNLNATERDNKISA